MEARVKLAKWLGDWHLVSFLGTVGLFSPVRVESYYSFVTVDLFIRRN